MTSLKYRVREDSTGWRWQVLTDDGQTVASGTASNQSKATAAAVRAGMHAMSSGEILRPDNEDQ
jgi:hypothetical protein